MYLAGEGISLHFSTYNWLTEQHLVNRFPTIYDNYCLLSLPLMYFGGQYCKHCEPRSDCSSDQGSYVGFHDTICQECICIYAAAFSGQKY